ncbi:MAG: sugar transferase [Coleofasciculaceae cyanobacterium]
MPEQNIQAIPLKEYPTIHLPRRISVIEAVNLKTKIQQLLQTSYPLEKVVLDCSQTTFIDSSGIGALVSAHKISREKEVRLIHRGVTPQMMAVLKMTALDRVLTIESLTTQTKPVTAPEPLPETHPSVRSWVKRLIDLVGATIGLGITAIAFIPIAAAIKFESHGPIFFGQIRQGWMGKEFKIWKFRSMYTDAEERKKQLVAENQADGKTFKMKNDPRVTKVGRFLRKTSLDELPQFWNVLKGEMSLVGTRPPTPNEVDIYEVPEWQRLDVKPGMTGEWQVSGRSTISKFEDIIALDLRYQRNWSLTHDIKLIIKTILVVFSKNSGAN